VVPLALGVISAAWAWSAGTQLMIIAKATITARILLIMLFLPFF
jgi:hypothetical protein